MSASIHIPREFCGLASCDRNFLAGQVLVRSDRKIASQLSPVLMAIGPSSKLKGYRTGAEIGYVNLRRWFFCDTGISSGSTFQQFNHALRIGASGHVHGDFDRPLAIRKSPVSHLTRDERSVRHDDFRTIGGANDAGPDPDAADLSHNATYLDDVTDFNRTFKKQNQAGHKIIDHVLQSKSDSHGECPGQECNLCQINPECAQGDEEAY